jgi:hypothetical protein
MAVYDEIAYLGRPSPTAITTTTTRLRVAGALAGVLFGAGLFSIFLVPGGGTVTDTQFTDFYRSGTSRAAAMILYATLVVGSWLLAWFYTELRRVTGPGAISDYAGRLAWLGSGATIIGGAIALAPTAVQVNSGGGYVGIPLEHTFDPAGLLVVVGGIYSYALATFLLCLHARNTRVAPRWQTLTGMIVAVLLLAAYLAVPAILLPAWVLMSAVTYRGSRVLVSPCR